jgi:hypothetical protein
MGRIFHAMGLLPTDHLVEVHASDLVSAYRGNTPKQTNTIIDNAMGGVLFIDEAYALVRPGSADDPGQEAVVTLLKRMEDDKGKFVVIAAGYHSEMDVFLDSNTGLRRRFTNTVEFADYNGTDLHCIFQRLCEAEGVSIEDGFDEALADHLDDVFTRRDANFGNAGTVRKLYDKVSEACGERVSLLGLPKEEQFAAMRVLTRADLDDAIRQLGGGQ